MTPEPETCLVRAELVRHHDYASDKIRATRIDIVGAPTTANDYAAAITAVETAMTRATRGFDGDLTIYATAANYESGYLTAEDSAGKVVGRGTWSVFPKAAAGYSSSSTP